jgi:hypothetical protein
MPPVREIARQLAAELRLLHRALLQAGRVAYEAEHGPVAGATQLLHLVVHDPAFAWLRPLSELMADFDGILDLAEPLTEQEAGAVRGEIEHVLSPAGGELAARAVALVAKDPEIAIPYARVRQLLLGLPAPPAVDAAEALHARHRWAEARRHRSHREP